ncbi:MULTISPECIES: 50S ribosomal protein L10 [Candidatus Neomicrothrix]|jgi:large subunit ribosomal protein L10|uniref:Large ribosomal subunit protein uL10 n=1 Tax=Candidatus Neomicrothrix parvicella RN1 TaxID=1229780 RepID=R4Z637_9ACTN|nr:MULTISPECIES: 50S ribosomal protein L10 [Microthrix]NLH65281.1 50S ribosomal protein L10 [Candidatus Microthrix parvicella]MBK7020580.1 50S ribosomal protein L10 [Candidatus Microthrix sp.]MBK7322540.1 50S ribosomal protein L10 [Candidatus Microthrix sp.]MBL0205530.1 50S ribosomal protein L10 [Candidatus Microthrix sp.]MBP6133689.1 50S ribosomal protein L10 [Candidatus Microthrix sp.]
MTDDPTELAAEADAKEPRADKVAVVTEVKERMSNAEAVILTEYRGLTVKELQSLRASLTEAGAVYKVYKNTLVRRAADELDWDLAELLVGPTAMAFVATDVGSAAKALTDFAKTQPLLVLKGGVMGGDVLDAGAVKELADLPTGPEIYSKLAGGIAGTARGLAAGIHGTHRSLAYVLQAAIDGGAFADADASAASEPVADEAPADEAPADEAPAESTPEEASASDTSEAPADDATTEEPPAAAESTEES